jgi:PAS domain S-box-containing protein
VARGVPRRLRPEDLGIGRLFSRVHEAVVAAEVTTERIVLWNPAAERLLGYTSEEALGMRLERLVPERLRGAHRNGLAAYRTTGHGRVVDADAAVELPALRRDGTELPVELTLASADEAGQGTRYVVALIRDVSERRRAEEEHRRLLQEQAARAQAEVALRLMDEFLAVAAHELKTPAAVLRLAAQAALRRMAMPGGLAPERVRETLETIDDGAARLGVLASQLLDTARLQAGVLQLDALEVDAVDAVQGALRRLAPTDRRRVVVRAEGPAPVTADAERLQQVVIGLLENATKFSPADTAVDVEVRRVAGGVVVQVRDRGAGVAPAARPRLFERFYRADTGLHAPGLGLGLYLGRRLAELMGGTLEAEFPPDGGTLMTLRLGGGRRSSPPPVGPAGR